MSIQNSINSIVGTGAVMAGLYANSPAGQRLQEKNIAKRDLKNLDEQRAIVKQSITPEDAGDPAVREFMLDQVQRLTDLRKRMFQLDPNSFSYNKFIDTAKASGKMQRLSGEIDKLQNLPPSKDEMMGDIAMQSSIRRTRSKFNQREVSKRALTKYRRKQTSKEAENK